MQRRKNWRYYSFFVTMCFFLLLAGCAPEHTRLEQILDTPAHHVSNGFTFLDRGRVEDAQREFESALRLDGSFAQAHCGLGLVAGKRKDFQGAFQSMELAKKYAKTGEDRAMVSVAEMRLYTMKKGEGWLDHVKTGFDHAVGSMADWPEAYYYLGDAYTQAYRFLDAENAFRKVIDLHSRLVWQAENKLKTVKKIIKAMPESSAGKSIALRTAITRADVAALLVEELKLDKIYRNMARHEKTSPLMPVADRKSALPALPADVTAHPLRGDIRVALQLRVKGMECFPDGSFGPDQTVTRAEYAVIMGSILAIVRGDPTLNTRFSGKTSPFSDVGNEEPFFNAVMLCTSETSIMTPQEGIFNPAGTVSGADAVLALRKLKEELGIF